MSGATQEQVEGNAEPNPLSSRPKTWQEAEDWCGLAPKWALYMGICIWDSAKEFVYRDFKIYFARILMEKSLHAFLIVSIRNF
jgi:hypothetical protein